MVWRIDIRGDGVLPPMDRPRAAFLRGFRGGERGAQTAYQPGRACEMAVRIQPFPSLSILMSNVFVCILMSNLFVRLLNDNDDVFCR